MRILILHIVLFFFLIVHSLRSQDYLHCLSVNTSSEVLVQWDAPINSAEFASYSVYHSNGSSGGIYSLLTSIDDHSTTSFLHTSVDAGSESQFYYIETLTTSGDYLISDTLKSIFLTVNTGVGNVELNWTLPRDPPLSSWDDEFKVWMEYPVNNWNLIGSETGTNFFYEIQVCDDSLTFRIELTDNHGCKLVSNYKGGTYQDITKPPMPVIDSVSINQNLGKSIIGWNLNPAEDTEGYIVYKYINSSWIIIDTVYGRNNTMYIDMNSSPCSVSESYALAAFDSCGNKSLGTFLLPQKTIGLSKILYDPCVPSHTLNWTDYVNMNPALAGYEIFVSINGAQFQSLGTTSASVTTFTHGNMQYDNVYEYFIRAFEQNYQNTSSSCVKSNYSRHYIVSQYEYLANVSVLNNSYIQITAYIDASSYIQKVVLRKYNELESRYIPIDSVTNLSTDIVSFDDRNVDVNARSYLYDFVIDDSCNYEKTSVNSVNSIYLTADLNTSDEVLLEWNEISGWDGDVEAYNIFRKIGESGLFEHIATVGGRVYNYVDNLDAFITEGENFSYQVEAVEGPSNIYGFSEKSISNEAEIIEDAKIFFPNAFKPTGINRVFKPKGLFINQDDYLMQIYNRWGELLYESNSFAEGWNGEYEGQTAPPGVYLYIVSYMNESGTRFQHTGTFVLVW